MTDSRFPQTRLRRNRRDGWTRRLVAENTLSEIGNLPIYPQTATSGPSDPGDINGDNLTGVRTRENDNLTNFSGGRLN